MIQAKHSNFPPDLQSDRIPSSTTEKNVVSIEILSRTTKTNDVILYLLSRIPIYITVIFLLPKRKESESGRKVKDCNNRFTSLYVVLGCQPRDTKARDYEWFCYFLVFKCTPFLLSNPILIRSADFKEPKSFCWPCLQNSFCFLVNFNANNVLRCWEVICFPNMYTTVIYLDVRYLFSHILDRPSSPAAACIKTTILEFEEFLPVFSNKNTLIICFGK